MSVGDFVAVKASKNGRVQQAFMSGPQHFQYQSLRLVSPQSWFEAMLPKLSRKSDTTAAIRYALSRWDALLRLCEDGSLEIDNNAAERSLRGVVLGRKNYLFAGSDAGEERAAAILQPD